METNLREQLNAITLRSGKKLEEPHQREEMEEETTNKELINSTNQPTQVRRSPKQPVDGWSPSIKFTDPNVKPYVLPLPFPKR